MHEHDDQEKPTLDELLADSKWLKSVARRLVQEDATADDLVQETRLYALRRPPQSDKNLEAWIHTVARSLLVSLRRRERTRRSHESHHRVQKNHRSPIDELELREIRDVIARAVLDLPEHYRDTLLLLYFEEQSTSAVSESTGDSVTTVRVRHMRALRLLRAKLQLVFDEFISIAKDAPEGDLTPLNPLFTRLAPILVLTPDGEPVSGATVSFLDHSRESWEDSSFDNSEFAWWMKRASYYEAATTDGKGRCQVPALLLVRGGPVRISAPGFRTALDCSRLRTVEETPSVFEIRRPESATVKLVDTNGDALKHRTVRVRGQYGGEVTSVTDSQGCATYSWDESLHVIEVEVEGHAATRALARAPTMEVSLQAGVRGWGRVVDSRGTVVEGAEISLRFPG